MTTLNRLPSLSDSTLLRYTNFIALYFAEGLHMGMLFVGIPAWMAMAGKTPGEIGAFATACALPWTFKFVAAPLMDRYTYLPMGRKRPWVLFGQIGLTISFLAMGYVPDPLNNLQVFMGAAFVVSIFGALQDGATDGMAVDSIPEHQQARANGFMGGSRMIGSSFALALGSWLLNAYSFKVSMLVLSVLIGLMTFVPLFSREQPGEKIAPWTAGVASAETRRMQVSNWSVIFGALFSVFRLRNSVLVALLMFITMGAYNYFETLLPIFAVTVSGWTNVAYSRAFATADLIGGVGGIVLGGYLIERFGKKRMINVYLLMIMLLTSALVFLKMYWTNAPFVYGFIVVYRWFNAFAKIGVYAVAMQCCSRKISASQFTLFMTLGATGSMVGATLIGPVKENFNWDITLLAFVGMLAIACLLLQFLNISQQVAQLSEVDDEVTERQALLVE